MRKIKVSDVLTQVRRLIFQPDPENSNFSQAALLSFFNEVKDDIFSDVPMLPLEKLVTADGTSNEFVIADDVNRIERVLLNDELFEFLGHDEFLSSEKKLIFTNGKFLDGRSGVYARGGSIFVKPDPKDGDEIRIRFRAIPPDFRDTNESFIAPSTTRQTFIHGVLWWCKLALERESNSTNIQNTSAVERRYNAAKQKLAHNFSRADKPRENVIREVM